MNTQIRMPDRTTAWGPGQLQILWAELETQITPFTEVLSMNGDLWRQLDGGAKRWIADNFMNQVQESVLYVRDGSGCDRYFLGNSRHFIRSNGMIIFTRGSPPYWIVKPNTTVQTAEVAPLAPAKVEKACRPPNPFILYRKDRHAMVKMANPGVNNNQISRILGDAWNKETADVRRSYQQLAAQYKQAHFEKYPDYRYKPRKPSEKKRRARRNDNALAATNDEPGTSPASMADDVSEN